MNKVENFISKITKEDLEILVEDYFSILDGISHIGNTSEPTEEEIDRRNKLTKKYGRIY